MTTFQLCRFLLPKNHQHFISSLPEAHLQGKTRDLVLVKQVLCTAKSHLILNYKPSELINKGAHRSGVVTLHIYHFQGTGPMQSTATYFFSKMQLAVLCKL